MTWKCLHCMYWCGGGGVSLCLYDHPVKHRQLHQYTTSTGDLPVIAVFVCLFVFVFVCLFVCCYFIFYVFLNINWCQMHYRGCLRGSCIGVIWHCSHFDAQSQHQWHSQGLPGWVDRPPRRPKWGKIWRKFEEKLENLKENKERLRKCSYLAHLREKG